MGHNERWPPFADRIDAGRQLAIALTRRAGLAAERPVIAALPRGGVPVGYEVAQALAAPLDVIVVGKLSGPRHPELALGALGEGVRVVDEDAVRAAGIDDAGWSAIEQTVRAAMQERARRLRAGREPVPLAGRTVVIVDDGIATGATARAACRVARAAGAARVIVAAPVAPPATVRALAAEADDVVCVTTPEPFGAVGWFYSDFSPTSEDEVVRLLHRAGR